MHDRFFPVKEVFRWTRRPSYRRLCQICVGVGLSAHILEAKGHARHLVAFGYDRLGQQAPICGCGEVGERDE